MIELGEREVIRWLVLADLAGVLLGACFTMPEEGV